MMNSVVVYIQMLHINHLTLKCNLSEFLPKIKSLVETGSNLKACLIDSFTKTAIPPESVRAFLCFTLSFLNTL